MGALKVDCITAADHGISGPRATSAVIACRSVAAHSFVLGRLPCCIVSLLLTPLAASNMSTGVTLAALNRAPEPVQNSHNKPMKFATCAVTAAFPVKVLDQLRERAFTCGQFEPDRLMSTGFPLLHHFTVCVTGNRSAWQESGISVLAGERAQRFPGCSTHHQAMAALLCSGFCSRCCARSALAGISKDQNLGIAKCHLYRAGSPLRASWPAVKSQA